MGNQYSEDLFRSIDTIVSARMSNLPYDQTMIAYISDTSQSAEGIYKAKYESLEVTAYSENTEYKLGDQVYISVPRADYNQKKIILGRIPQDKEEIIKIRPFENFVSCTKNFNEMNREVSIIANKQNSLQLFQKYNNYKEVCSYSFSLNNNYKQNAGYDLLGLKVNLSAAIENNSYAATAGDYGLLVHLEAYDQTQLIENADEIISLAANSIYYQISLKDMININHYNTYGYCSQEKVFNIKNYLIKSLTVYLVQYKDFTTIDGTVIPADQELLISCKDLEITFGYEGRPSNFTNGKLLLYSPDGYLYNSNEDSSKEIYSRFIISNEENIEVYSPPANYDYVRWYRYDNTASDYNEILGTTSYVRLDNINSLTPNIIFEATQTPAQNKRYRLAISKDNYNWLVSDALVFINNINLINSELFDVLNGFQVTATGDNEGIFNLYGQDNLLLNDAESFRVHHLRLTYNATAENRRLRAGDVIKWKIPSERTMLLPADKLINEVVLKDNGDLDDDKSFLVPFKIKNLYNPNYTQNTIQCELILKEDNGTNTVLTCNKELLFGTSGSSGNDYILVLELCAKNNQSEKISAILSTDTQETCQNKYTIVPHLYNYAMKEIVFGDSEPEIKYSWLNTNTFINRERINGKENIDFNGLPAAAGARIIKAEIDKYGVTAYLPIATKYDSDCEYMEGCKTIVYDITGKKPMYQKFENIIGASLLGEKFNIENQNLILKYYDSFGEEQEADQALNLPKLVNKTIIPPSVYSTTVNNMFLEIYLSGRLAWVQPILITKNKYPSAMLNAEMNITALGNWQVKQNLIGQVKDTGDTNVSGFLIGQLSSDDNSDVFGMIASNEKGDFFRILADTGEVYIKNALGNIESASQAAKLVISTADKTGFNVGGEDTPVYFLNGVPVECGHKLVPASTITELQNSLKALKEEFNEAIKELEETIDLLRQEIETLKS